MTTQPPNPYISGQQLPAEAYQYAVPPTGYATPPQPTPQKGPGRWLIPLLVGVAALVIGVAIGGAGKSSSKNAAQSTTTVSATVTVTKSAAAPAQTTAIAAKTTPKPAAPTRKRILTINGSGAKQTANFVVTQDQWTITYAYDCAAFGGSGNFIVDVSGVGDTDDSGAQGVNELSPKANSSTVEHGAGTYYLSVNSECNWTIHVDG